MNRSVVAVAALALLALAGPLPGQDFAEPVKAQVHPDATLPTDLDRVLRDYERAWRAGDAAALAALFAEDGFILQSDRPAIRGRAAIQAAYEGQGGAPLRLRALAYSAGDTSGYIIGAYGYGESATGDMGKFTLTLRRRPGEPWMIFSDMDNMNAPPKPRQPTSP